MAIWQPDGTVDVVWRGENRGLWHHWFVDGTWNGPESLGDDAF
jgi:hypothetical protein